MVNKEPLKTEKYRFCFKLLRVPVTERSPVIVDTYLIERRKVTDEDIHELEEYFDDMGKWENFVKAGKSLLQDLGIPIKIEKEEKREFGVEKYEKQLEKTDYDKSIMVTIKLTAKEISRRSARSKNVMLPPKEIREQLKNVPKWQTLKKTLSELKEKL